MNALLEKYSGKGLVAAGFPCNQFELQEPGLPHEILPCYSYVRPGKGWIPHANFHFLNKTSVNGKDENQLYAHLKSVCPSTTEAVGTRSSMFWDHIKCSDITWNYEKFLIDRNGKPRYRFNPVVLPREMEPYIDSLL